MRKNIRIVDTTLRDGAQAPGIYFGEEEKLKIALALDACGVAIIEAGVPAMGKEEQRIIRKIKAHLRRAEVKVWNRLVETDILASLSCEPDIIHISVPVSDRQITDKLHSTRLAVQKKTDACLALVRANNYQVSVGFEDASRADEDFLEQMIDLVKDYEPLHVRYADTVGVLTPVLTYKKIKRLAERGAVRTEFHAHNDLGLALANVLAAVQAGAELADTTLLGIGERAGNCDFLRTVELLTAFDSTDISVAEALAVQNKLSGLMSDEWRSFR